MMPGGLPASQWARNISCLMAGVHLRMHHPLICKFASGSDFTEWLLASSSAECRFLVWCLLESGFFKAINAFYTRRVWGKKRNL